MNNARLIETLTDDAGVAAIIMLQKFMNKDEPEEKARKGWDALRRHERESTMKAYAVCYRPKERDLMRLPVCGLRELHYAHDLYKKLEVQEPFWQFLHETHFDTKADELILQDGSRSAVVLAPSSDWNRPHVST